MLIAPSQSRRLPMFNLRTIQKPAADGEKIAIPKLAGAAAILASINLTIGFCIALTPDLNVALEGIKQDPPGAYSAPKPSPFVNQPDAKPRKPRSAQMLTPVLAEAPSYSAYELNIPRSSLQNAIYVSEPPDRPQGVSPASSVHPGADVTPRRATERPQVMVIN
jgi:hypothetical protein